jgi:hypothetical protein
MWRIYVKGYMIMCVEPHWSKELLTTAHSSFSYPQHRIKRLQVPVWAAIQDHGNLVFLEQGY